MVHSPCRATIMTAL